MINFNSPEKAAAIVAKLEERLAQATAEAAQARLLYESACFAVEEKQAGAEKGREQARRLLAAAEDQVKEAEATIRAAKARHESSLALAAKKREVERWAEVEKMTLERAELAAEVEDLAQKLVPKLNALAAMGEKIYQTAPGKRTTYFSQSFLEPGRVIGAFKRRLGHMGAEWAYRVTSTSQDQPFKEYVNEGNKWILQERKAWDATEKTSEQS